MVQSNLCIVYFYDIICFCAKLYA